jgi:hypothetical protein
MEGYKFVFSSFFMNDKNVIAVLCFGSHICNQAARIRVNILPSAEEDFFYETERLIKSCPPDR